MIKVLQFRLGDKDNFENGIASQATVEGAINGYMKEGWSLFSFVSGGSNADGTQIVVVLTKPATTAK